MTSSTPSPHPLLPFDHDPDLFDFTVSPPTYITSHSRSQYDYIATSAIVFDTSPAFIPRILLIQRAASDSAPNKWETPGGGCDDDDESILHAVVRELWEEAGLTAVHIGARIGEPQYFVSSGGKRICKVYFIVDVRRREGEAPNVRLSPKEHQAFVWASEEEVGAEKVGGTLLEFTSKEQKEVICMAFAMLKDH